MNMTLNFSPRLIIKLIIKFFRRFHLVMFVIVVVGGLAIVTFLLNSVVIHSNVGDGYTSHTNSADFDQATIKRINELKTRDQNDNSTLPSGRTNPFVE